MGDTWEDSSTHYEGGDPWWPYKGGAKGGHKRDRAADSPMRAEQEATDYYRQRSREVQERIKKEQVQEEHGANEQTAVTPVKEVTESIAKQIVNDSTFDKALVTLPIHVSEDAATEMLTRVLHHEEVNQHEMAMKWSYDANNGISIQIRWHDARKESDILNELAKATAETYQDMHDVQWKYTCRYKKYWPHGKEMLVPDKVSSKGDEASDEERWPKKIKWKTDTWTTGHGYWSWKDNEDDEGYKQRKWTANLTDLNDLDPKEQKRAWRLYEPSMIETASPEPMRVENRSSRTWPR